MGFLGILEDNKLAHVPATVILDDVDNQTTSTIEAAQVRGRKHGTGKDSHIILVPQPSDDPNDPLNWPMTKKITITLILCFGGCLFASVISGLLNAGLFVIATDYKRPIEDLVLLSGYQLLVAGSTGTFVTAFSKKYDKRPVFLISSILGVVGSLVGSLMNNYQDIYFVHQRGFFMSMTQFVLGCVSNFVGIVCGPITTNLGWRYLFHLCVLFCGLQTVLLYLFCPESQYNRSAIYNTDEVGDQDLEAIEKLAHETAHVEGATTAGPGKPTTTSVRPIPTKKTFVQELAIFTGVYTEENLLQLIVAPFVVCTNLAVLWVVVVTGTMTATYVAQAIVLAQIFSPPPYLLSATGVGNLFLGPFAGGVIATVVLALIYDPIIRTCARKNNGVYEPEYRLVIIVFGLVGGAGMMGWGILCENHATVYATAALHGLVLFGIMFVVIAASAYGLDAYRDISSDIFVAGIIYKNFLFYGFSNFVSSWVASVGPSQVFYVLGGLNLAMVCLTPLIFVFGKRYRSFWARHNVLEKLHLKGHPEL
ncbi:hypothetical protein LTS15_003860 [Exophiala xenobiotica]|nr:hypothetical protein LTS15_003860 [Exophiala xenobiotica]